MNQYLAILKHYWGYDSFREPQGDIIRSVAEGRDTLALMPTGGGKSITFQVPALAREGLCLVVSPLIALMKDQVDNLKARGIKAAAIYTGMTRSEQATSLENCIYGDYKFLYVSPERLSTRAFGEKAHMLNVSLIAVDESHCISQWGYDFRPQYLKIAEVRKLFPDAPVLALTATATEEVAADIQDKLAFRAPNVIRTSFFRKNLAYVTRKAEDKSAELLRVLRGVPGSSIVYVRNRRRTAEVAEFLRQNDISACHYHAGLGIDTKNDRLEKWRNGTFRVMAATNAFGMGIDKPDVRSVIHIDVPDSPEAYFQEAGRAGRDGLKAFAVLIYDGTDIQQLRRRVATEFPSKEFAAKVYDSVCNFFGIGVHEAEGMLFRFDLFEFCRRFRFAAAQTDSALRILTLAGFIEYIEDDQRPPMVMMKMERDSLYSLKTSGKLDRVLQLLLRSYTGLFSEYAAINLQRMGEILGCSTKEVSDMLVELSKRRVLTYVPPANGSSIYFTRGRQPEKYLRISREVYETRKERYESRIEAMINYAESNNACRSGLLLKYFGEKATDDCGICDVCLAKKKLAAAASAEARVLELLSARDMTARELSAAAGRDEKIIMSILRHNIDNGRIVLSGNMLSLKK